jgi:ferric iron reductase protein FhuF
VLTQLFGAHLTPLVEQVNLVAGSPRQILWGQIAYECSGLFYDTLEREAPEARTAALADDRAALFDSRAWPVGSGPNPLYQPTRDVTTIDPETGEPDEWAMRTTCCLIYKADPERMCGACPLWLKEEQLVAKLAERDERRAAPPAAEPSPASTSATAGTGS